MNISPSELNVASRLPGISGFMRLKDEELYLDAAIKSHIEHVDELILVFNNCTDSTPEICRKWQNDYPEKVKVFEYTPYVFPLGTVESRTLPPNDPSTLASFYNYALSKTTRKIAIKIDGDHIAIPGVFSKAAQQARELKDNEWLSLRGANLFEFEGKLFISNGYNKNLLPKAGRSGGNPPITGGDHAFFTVAESTWHEMDRREGYEILRLHKIKDVVISYSPVAFLHLKEVKNDKGMKNWELDRFLDSSRQAWAKSVHSTRRNQLLTVTECSILYERYFSDYPHQLLCDFGIDIKYAKCTLARRIGAILCRLFKDYQSELKH